MMYDRAKLHADLIRDEGLKFEAYQCSASVWTIGVGHTRGVRAGMVCTREQALDWLDEDIDNAVSDLDRRLPWWRDLDEARQRALINLCFNIGINRLFGFKRALHSLALRDYAAAAAHFLDSKWADQVKGRAQRVAALIHKGSEE